MCIIAIKKSGINFPTEETIENMWYSNPDGAGIMYTKDGNVVIDKGYMKLSEFLSRIDRLKDEIDTTEETVVLHFRIGTAGGNTPENTHPFPISKKIHRLQAKHVVTDIGVVHNGIIDIKRPIKEISDTMEYIRSKLVYIRHQEKAFYKNKKCLKRIAAEITSKMAFLLPDRNVYTIGEFITDKDGMVYSNSSYKTYGYGKLGMGWDYFSDFYDDFGYGEDKGITISYDALMPLDEPCYLVCHDTGNMFGVEDVGYLFMDSDGQLYVMNCDDEGYEFACPIADNCTAFNGNGYDVRYDSEKSILMEVREKFVYALPW